jgi:hypothetical protein
LLWPRPSVDPLSAPAAQVCRDAAAQVRSEAQDSAAVCAVRTAETTTSINELRRAFTATPYRPTGLSTGSRAIVRLVDELTWLSAILEEPMPGATCEADAAAVHLAAAEVLDRCAELLADPRAGVDTLTKASEVLRDAVTALEDTAVERLPSAYRSEHELLSNLNVSFRAQEVAFAVR